MWHNVHGGLGHSHSKKKIDVAHRVGAHEGHGHIKSNNKKKAHGGNVRFTKQESEVSLGAHGDSW